MSLKTIFSDNDGSRWKYYLATSSIVAKYYFQRHCLMSLKIVSVTFAIVAENNFKRRTGDVSKTLNDALFAKFSTTNRLLLLKVLATNWGFHRYFLRALKLLFLVVTFICQLPRVALWFVHLIKPSHCHVNKIYPLKATSSNMIVRCHSFAHVIKIIDEWNSTSALCYMLDFGWLVCPYHQAK